MKAVVVKLKVKERKALDGVVSEILAANEMMTRAGKILAEQRPMLWEMLNGMYPKDKGAAKTFNYQNFEMSYFVPSTKQEEFKMLKEEAVTNKDFELAARYRDLERKEQDR